MNDELETLLDKWSERLFKEVETVQEKLSNIKPNNEYSYGRKIGYLDGLLMASAFMSRMEKLYYRSSDENGRNV